VSVTFAVDSWGPDDGLMLVSVGGGGRMVKARGLLVPPGVVIVTSRGPSAAALPICTVIVAWVALTIVIALIVMSGPASKARPVVKLVPRTSRSRVVVWGPTEGDTLVNVGPGPGITVKITGVLVPPGVVTVTLRIPKVVSGEILNRAVTMVPPDGPEMEMDETVIPLPASIVRATKF
jgi:hypothetical protein